MKINFFQLFFNERKHGSDIFLLKFFLLYAPTVLIYNEQRPVIVENSSLNIIFENNDTNPNKMFKEKFLAFHFDM